MVKVIKILSTIQKVDQSVEGGPIKIVGYASTSDTDRVGDVILPAAWTLGGLDNYQKNPIILFNHNYNKPVGRAIQLEVDSKGLKITCEISPSADEVYGLIKDGVLTTFSVGFLAKEADYNEMTDGYIIKNAELLEVSVVTVPCNQEAIFSLSKSLTPAELEDFRKSIIKGEISKPEEAEPASEKNLMDEETVNKLVAEATAKALAAQEQARKEAEEKAAAEKEAATRLETVAKQAAEAATKSTEERLLADFAKSLKENNENLEKTFNEYKTTLEEKNADLLKMVESKRNFGERTGNTDLLKDAAALEEAKDIFVFSKIMNTKFDETAIGKQFMEKYNQHSAVNVGQDKLELTVGTEIERDIWNDLVLAPLFREIKMNSAKMTIPLMPDAGYAEITGSQTASGTSPIGNLDPRGAAYGTPYAGIGLGEQTLSTVKMIARSYLGNETEEDAIIPILPLIRESMVRSHARGVENLILAGNHADGTYTANAADGLIKLASTNSRTVTSASAATKHTGAALFSLRKAMGKYGINPRDVAYIVSQQAYFELIEDPEFADMDLVGNAAMKLTGEVGRIYGSSVIMCDEFAPAAAGKYSALAVNRRNFLVPRLRGVTVESQYETGEQRTVLVTSQRLGFSELIPNATAVVGLKYGA